MTQRAAFETMIDLNAEKVVSIVKITGLNAEMTAEKIMVVLVFKIDGGNINTAMTLLR